MAVLTLHWDANRQVWLCTYPGCSTIIERLDDSESDMLRYVYGHIGIAHQITIKARIDTSAGRYSRDHCWDLT